MRVKQVVAPSMLILLFAAVLIQLPMAIVARASDYDVFDPVIDIHHLIAQRFVEAPETSTLQEGMIAGMIEVLDDPHTLYIPPRHEGEFNKGLRGTYVGIGAEVNIRDEYLLIVSPLDGSPALAAGIRAGDLVLEIEGESTFQQTMDQCIKRLVGKPKTPVSVKVRHVDGTEEDIIVIRDRIITRTVRGMRRLGKEWTYCIDDELNLVYVRVTQFNDSTMRELREVFQRLQSTGINGMVFDLRDNPGGELSAAVAMSDMFIDEGTILSIRDRNGDGQVYRASAAGTLPNFPMIVMVNENSASASEIVSGALQQAGRAKVLGTRSHGKGSVQEVHQLPLGGGTFKITTAHYHLADGSNIHKRPDSAKWGVDPDAGMYVRVTDEAAFKRGQARHDFEIIRDAEDGAMTCSNAAFIREKLEDEQLARAVEILRDRVNGEPWPAVDELETEETLALDTELERAYSDRSRAIRFLNSIDERIERIQTMAADAGAEPHALEDVDLLAGSMILRDRHGNIVGEYRINGGDVVAALETIELSPIE